jgi:putative hydrolase
MLKIDLHIHTIYSGHAQCTIVEYIEMAKKLKMKVIGFSDHGPNMAESMTNDNYFFTMTRIPRFIEGVEILRGIEANIIDSNGAIDITDKMISENLDYVMAAIHRREYKNLGSEKNTEAMIRAIKSGKIDILSHPFYEYHPVNVGKIFEEACRRGVLLEVNLNTIKIMKSDAKIMTNLKLMVQTAKRFNKKLIVGSDAHNIWDLADDSKLNKIKKEIGLTDKMIINNYPQELMQQLRIKN